MLTRRTKRDHRRAKSSNFNSSGRSFASLINVNCSPHVESRRSSSCQIACESRRIWKRTHGRGGKLRVEDEKFLDSRTEDLPKALSEVEGNPCILNPLNP